ncbi:WD repeat-containing protein 55-like isoform X1 [Branchiostoma floridae]|uniref:WD repeat-containing protein 55 n=1 Tax=Branchiostoma floridae TaxID=7739 RepID=A0A9J7LHR1_BRAFL|nr:WD repeat-containing protein 55-like isoform X1 [Branchiostoma floridae]
MSEGKEESEDDKVHIPPDITFEDLVVDINFHPSKPLIAAGIITGDVILHSYASSANTLVRTFKHHKKATRAVAFSKDGNSLITSSKDKSLQVVDVETGKVSQCFSEAHPSPVYCQLVISDRLLATGDDDGNVKLWDLRKGHPIMELQENQDFISDMAVDEEKRFLLATSGDGTMTTFNIRRRKMVMQSENMEDEMLSVAIVKDGTKVICGTGEGALNFFNWEEFGNISDRFPGHPMSVDCIVPVTENIVCTGSMDGVIRAVNILPNRFMGVVGEHEEFPIEQIRITPNSEMIASCSHDQKIKFWHVAHLEKETIDASKKAKRDNKPKNLKKTAGQEDFFADFGKDLEVKPATEDDLSEEEDDSNNEEESENGEAANNGNSSEESDDLLSEDDSEDLDGDDFDSDDDSDTNTSESERTDNEDEKDVAKDKPGSNSSEKQ